MKFSVIIPTYKGIDTISIAITSVVMQSYNYYEIIVSDDNELGSTEQIDTEIIVNQYQKKHNNIIYLKNGHHNGSYARNKGIEIARGDYITLLDDDDFYCKDYLKKANTFLEKNRDVDLLYFDVVTITQEQTVKIASCPTIDSKKLLFGKAEIGTGSNLCFKNDNHFFDERYIRHQDIEFACKMMNNYKYKWIEETEIVKFYNNNDNYPNVEMAIKMQKLLREDMLNNKIISNSDIHYLENIQLHSLYNDLLIKNALLSEINKVIYILKNKKTFGIVDNILFFIYCISKNIFNKIFNVYAKKKYYMVDSDLVNKIKNIRKELERFSK